MAREDTAGRKSLAVTLVIYELSRLAVALKVLVFQGRVYKWSINPITNLNPAYYT
jgi:hypothetical protein